MFFLLRVAFWLTIVCLLLPGMPINLGASRSHDPQAGTRPGTEVGAIEALSAASSAMADAGGFCERQPQACAIGGGILGMLGERAEAGARLALGYITEQILDQKRRAAERSAGSPAGDTLTTHDLSPEWQGPHLPGGADVTGSTAPAGKADGDPAAPAVPLPPKRPA